MRGWLIAAAAIVGVIVAAQFFSIFVVQPIGAVPDGKTVIITRLTNVKFIDSADAVCERMSGGVSILCRGIVMGRVAKEAKIIARLPYSDVLYGISTGGKRYDR